MSEKKVVQPFVYVLLAVAAVSAAALAWNTFRLLTRNPLSQEQQESKNRLDESTAQLREASAKVEAVAWGEGVAFATTAAQLTQTAKTPAEWEAVADIWLKAANRMYRVPESDPNYATAQQRMVHYQKNMEYAKQRAGQ